ncbi:MAG: hypothetical protein PHQ40_02775 [Anaerolineaceae bacterium]|nr:hypothetical protein [Anaerolineaceae bacterium]
MLAYWPGMMSADSFDQWGQITTGIYNDHHPTFHTVILWFLTRIWPSPAIVALVQIIGLAFLAGGILAYFEELGVPGPWLWFTGLVFGLSPVNGTMVVTLWKDIPYSTVVMGLVFLLVKLVQSKGSWILLPRRWLLLGITAALIPLLRHDGAPVVAGVFVLILAAYPKKWKPLVMAAVTAAGLYFGVTGPLYQLLNVRRTTELSQWTTSLYAIAANASPGTPLDSIFDSIQPFSSKWDCAVLDQLGIEWKRNPTATSVSLIEKVGNLARHSISLGIYNYRCLRSPGWIIRDVHQPIYNTSHVEVLIDSNSYGIRADTKLPGLQSVITPLVVKTASDPNMNWLIWRPALYLYIFIFISVVLTLRYHEARILLIAAPMVIQSILFSLVLVNPNFRYHYTTFITALLFWPLIFSSSWERRRA